MYIAGFTYYLATYSSIFLSLDSRKRNNIYLYLVCYICANYSKKILLLPYLIWDMKGYYIFSCASYLTEYHLLSEILSCSYQQLFALLLGGKKWLLNIWYISHNYYIFSIVCFSTKIFSLKSFFCKYLSADRYIEKENISNHWFWRTQ